MEYEVVLSLVSTGHCKLLQLYNKSYSITISEGTWSSSWMRHWPQAGRWRVGFPMVSLEFFIDIILLVAEEYLYSYFNLGSRWGWVVSAMPLSPPLPQKRDLLPILREGGWAPGPVWTGAENVALTEILSPDTSEFVLNTKEADSSVMLVFTYITTACHVPEDYNAYTHLCSKYHAVKFSR